MEIKNYINAISYAVSNNRSTKCKHEAECHNIFRGRYDSNPEFWAKNLVVDLYAAT